MRRWLAVGATAVAGVVGAGCGPEAPSDELRARLLALATPAEYAAGERAFATFCARCHGERALGTDEGPPLVHSIYEPGHHADFAFERAVRFGVRAHHWRYGDMPAVPEVPPDSVKDIIAYVRWLQREAGID